MKIYKNFRLFLLGLCVLLCACAPNQSAHSITKIDANQYDSFWIWGNITSAPYLKKAKELYILQGSIQNDKQTKESKIIPQGVGVLKIPQQKVWLVYRNHILTWNNNEINLIISRIKQWESFGNQIEGIQIDFDSQTKNLKEYAIFLEKIRQQLPQKYRLSITGLMDWANIQNQETLSLLRNNIDEIVIRTYQATKTIENYQAYLQRIETLKLPFKIGLVQKGLGQA